MHVTTNYHLAKLTSQGLWRFRLRVTQDRGLGVLLAIQPHGFTIESSIIRLQKTRQQQPKYQKPCDDDLVITDRH